MHQSINPSLSQTIWPRWVSRQSLTLTIVQTLLPVTFVYSLCSRKNLEAVVMRQLRRWKRLWRRTLNAHTRGLPWSLPQVIGTVKEVHCSRKRLLRRELEFHLCIINKSANTKKSLETYLMILLHLYAALVPILALSYLRCTLYDLSKSLNSFLR